MRSTRDAITRANGETVPATKICAFCVYDATGWLCAKCSKKHECEDESFLRVVNSPRAGVCAYGA